MAPDYSAGNNKIHIERGDETMPMKIYLAGPLFSFAEREWIDRLARFLRMNIDGSVFVPHEECINCTVPEEIFRTCKKGVDEADILIAVLDGADADSGTCWEAGYAYAMNKIVIGVRTDFRLCEVHYVNIMLHYGMTSLIEETQGSSEKLFERILEEIRKTASQ